MPIDDGTASTTSEEAHETPFAAEKRWALVIGVNETASALLAPLRNAEQDARDVAATLQEQACGFRLCQPPLIGEQATSNAIKTALRAFGKERSEEDFLLLYFSGHGILRPGEANEQMVYLGSADFVESDGEEEAETHVSLKWLRRWLYEKTNAKRVLLILDCCFAGEMGRTAPDHYIKDLQDRIRFYLEGTGSSSDARWGGLRLTLTATGHLMGASDEDGQKRMAEYLLPALQGKVDEVIEDDGAISIQRLHRYLQQQLPEQQPSLSGDFAGCSCILANYPEYAKERARARNLGQNRQAERMERLRIALTDHSAFLQNRLASFVGRVNELGELEQRIEQLLATGGYLTITGQAGQGKSSISAKLIERRGIEETAFHFIPLNPGPEHQIGLLRNLLARLILKYDLSDLYLASESRAALHDALLALLKEVTSKGGQEVIFIDGLDQLEEEQTGVRDLSFLPANPPAGIVFVLGTRPNDALRPLELLKPHMTYPLPNLSRDDFDLILQHRKVTLSSVLTDRFYEAMQQNALYLDLVAKELTEQQQQPLEELIQRLTENPEHLFSLAIGRFKRQRGLWRELIKPILGLLLVVQEPLSKRQMRKILGVDADSLNDGLEHLGGLVIRDEDDRYSLYHLKFRDFLQEDPARPHKECIFEQDEIASWHLRVAQWCEQSNIMTIWEDVTHDATEQGRRLYARSHYLAHLYYARQWQQLFAILDEGAFGYAKLAHDPSMRSYSLDLIWGERAASWEHYPLAQGIDLLPTLWRYTLLRCRLASRADSYPNEAFETMVLLGQSVKAIGMAELLTNSVRKVRVLLLMARLLVERNKQYTQAAQLVKRAMVVASLIENTSEKDQAASNLASYFTEVQQRQEAERVIATIQDSATQAGALRDLVNGLAKSQHWQEAERVIATIQDSYTQVGALSDLASGLAEVGDREAAEQFWQEAERVIATIQDSYRQVEALRDLASGLVEVGDREAAERLWQEAERVITTIQGSGMQVWALMALASGLAQAQQWETLLRIIQRFWKSAKTNGEALNLFPLALHFISTTPELGMRLYDAFGWVDEFLGG